MSRQASSSGPEGLSDGLDRFVWYGPSLDDDEAWGEPPDDELLSEGPALPGDAYEGIDWLSAADGGSVPDRFEQALGRLRAAADDLVAFGADPDLVLADRDRLIDWARSLEQTRNKLACPDQSLINLMESSGCRIDGPLGLFASPQAFLVALLGVRPGEARRRVQAARVLAPGYDLAGHRIDTRYPVLAQAQASGGIPADRIEAVTTALTEWEKLLDLDATPDASPGGANVTAETLAVAEEVLARQATIFGGRDLERVIGRVGDYLCPDGMVDNRGAQDAVRSLEVRPVTRGMHKGTYLIQGRLTAEAGAKALAVLDPLSKPQPVIDEHGHVVEPDRRDRGMRMHDAFDEVMDRSLHAGDLPAHGGTPTTLIITVEAEDVFTGTGTGVTETGDELPMDSVIGLADEAEIVRTVFHKETREVLFLGRTRRLASYAQTLALTARDGGCTFPGCSKTPKWCQRHHIVDWVKGGKTDLPNLTLLCAFHHYRFARHGWTAEYQNGRVWWRPPKIIDPDQKPILNTRHRGTPLIT